MGKIVVNGNDLTGQSIQIRFKLDSDATYTIITKQASDFPVTIQGLPTGKYVASLRNVCSNGQYSPWVDATSSGCSQPSSFAAVKSGSNFVITAGLVTSQTIIEVKITDPNGGVTSTIHDFGTGVHSGSFNIAIVNPTLYGTYLVQARGVCNNTSSPRYVSDFLPPVTVVNPAPIADGYLSALSVIGGSNDFGLTIFLKDNTGAYLLVPADMVIGFIINYVQGITEHNTGVLSLTMLATNYQVISASIGSYDPSLGDVIDIGITFVSATPNPNTGIIIHV